MAEKQCFQRCVVSFGLWVSYIVTTIGTVDVADWIKMERFYLAALFAAVEFGQVEKARAILEDNEIDINR